MPSSSDIAVSGTVARSRPDAGIAGGGHTPGPWEVQPIRVSGNRCIYSKEGYGIGEAWDLQGNPENAANAHLIAAAPALYAQLRFAVKLLSALPGFSGTAQVEAMRAALSLAEGRPQ